MADQPQFFNQWEAPPGYAPPPASDDALVQRVSKLVEFAARNGPSFVELIKKKQKDNAEYAFLFDGAGSAFYRWALYCKLYGLPMDQKPPQQQQQPAQSAAAEEAEALPPDVDSGFSQVLAALTGSKESIHQSQAWFMACVSHAPGMARMMAEHVRGCPDYARQLHTIYLANDILLKSRTAAEGAAVAKAFRPVLPGMLAATYARGGQTEEVRKRLEQIVDHWRGKSIYDGDTAAAMVAAMLTAKPSATIPEPGEKAEAAAAAVTDRRARSRARWDQQGDGAANGDVHATAQQPETQAQPVQQDYQAAMAAQQQQQQQQQPQPDYSSAAAAAAMPYGQPPPPQHDAMAYQQMQQYGQPAAPYQPVGYGGDPTYGMQPPMQAAMPDAYGYAHPGQQQPQQWGGPPPLAPQAGWGAPPPAASGMPLQGMPPQGIPPQFMPPPAQAGMWAQPPAMPPPAHYAPPAPVPRDPMSFPPGIIPQLVREQLKTDPPYSPLSPLEVEALGAPPPQEPDAYLRARIDRFYAELQDYRPGMSRADVEAEQRRQRRLDGRGGGGQADEDDEGVDNAPAGGRRAGRWEPMAADPMTGQNADGSFSRTHAGGSKAAGLGFDDPPPMRSGEGGDVFDSFRQSRSGRYHETLARNQFAAAAARGSG